MLLQKLLDAGCYTLTGDVIWHHPTRHNLPIARWRGGSHAELTPDGERYIDEILAGTPEVLEPPVVHAPAKKVRKKAAEPDDVISDLDALLGS